jgi:hypothetical protein
VSGVTRLKYANLLNKEDYRSALHQLQKQSFLTVDLLGVAMAMNDCSSVEAQGDVAFAGVSEKQNSLSCTQSARFVPVNLSTVQPVDRRSEYPSVYVGLQDDKFHRVYDVPTRPAVPPIGEVFEGMLGVIDGATIYYITNNTRRAVRHWEKIVAMGLDDQFVLDLRSKSKNQRTRDKHPPNHIPYGEDL